MAKLYFRYGAMGSGKTAQLLQVAFNYKERGMSVAVMKPKLDTKSGEKISTRIGIEREIDYLIKSEDNLYSVISNEFKNVDCILIDEAQFLECNQVDDLMKVTTELEIPVICYGLRTNFLTSGFSGSTRLLEIAHTIEELKTICKCGKKAIFNARYKNDVIVKEGDSIIIDNNSTIKYVSLCPSCYRKEMNKK
ncbi:MAG: thymidine kinase [Bacilli bacterium]|nr:thymidine kinase [Bacilli bacterium]